MAISSYGKALASMAKESVLGSVKGFGSSVKSAAMSEMPALTGAIAFARSLRKEAEKYQKETEKSNDEIKDEVKKQVKETRVGNVIGIESAKLLKSINANTVIQTRLMLQQAKFERQNRMFAEEESRERLLEQKKLLNAIRKIGMARGGVASPFGGSDSSGGEGGLFAGLGGLLGNVLGGAGAVGGGLLAYKGGKYLLDKFKKPKLDVLGSAKRNPALGNLASKAVDAKIIKGILPRILGGLFGGPVGWALTAYGIYELIDAIFDFDIFSSAQASTALPGSTQSTSDSVRDTRRGSRRRKSTQGTQSSTTSTKRGDFIRRKEGKRLTAYKDAAGYSIGYGYHIKQKDIERGYIDLGNEGKVSLSGEGGRTTQITEEQAETLFQLTLDTKEREIISQIGAEHYNKLSEDQKEAILSYYYNVGRLPGRLGQFAAAIRTNKFGEARELISKGIATSQGKLLPELQRRRQEEAQLFGNFTSSARRRQDSTKTFSTGYTLSGMLGKISERAEEERAEAIRTGAGSIVPTKLVVPVEDEIVAEKIDIQTKAIKNIESSSSKNLVETRRQNEMLSPTRRKETRNERIAREANERFLAGFQALTTTKITNALEKALFPKGYGVTAEETKSELYRGERLGDLLGTQRFFNRTFGAEYGPLFDQLSRSYLELGATNVGKFLFGGTAGVDAQALTGQILGNIQRGKKDVALEQLLYGMTGTSSGYETLFAKYGFGSAQQGVQTMGNIFGAGATDIVRRNMPFIGEVPGQTTYTDPATGRQIPYGGLMQSPFGTVKVGGLNAQAVFVTNDKQAGVSTTASASGAGRSVTIGDPSQIYGYGYGEELVQVNVDTNKTLTNQHNEQLSYLEKVHDDDKAWTQNSDKIRKENAAAGVGATMAAAASTGNVFTRGIEWLGSIFTSSAGRGGGTNLNIGFGGGGQPTFGNFLMDLGKTAVVSKLTSGIKDPYARQIANFGLNRAADVGIQTLMSGGNLSTFGANLATSFFGPNTALTSAYGATLGQQIGAQALGAVGLAGTAAAYSAMVPGLTAGSAQAAMLASQTGVFGSAGLSATAAAGSTATAGTAAAGSTLGGQLAALASNPVTWIVLAAILLFGSKKKAPTAVHKVIAIAGNSNIDAKAVVFTRHNPPKAYYDAADQFLNVAFNTTKMLEIRTGKRAPFDYIYMRVESDRVEIDYGTGALKEHLKSTGPLEGKRLGGGIHTVQIPLVAKQIVDHIGEKFKTASSEDTEKIEKGLEELGKKSLKSITSGIETSIGRQLDLAPSSAESSDLARSVQAASMAQQFQAPVMQTISSGDSEESTGERLIYDFRTGKMVRQSDTGFGVTKGKQQISDGEGGTYEVDTTTYDETIIGIDKAGNPIYGISGGLFKGYAPSFREHLEKNPDLLTSITPAPGTIPAAEKVTPQGPTLTDMLKSIAERAEEERGGGVTVVNTDNSSQSVTNNTLSIRASSSDSLVFSGAGLPT